MEDLHDEEAFTAFQCGLADNETVLFHLFDAFMSRDAFRAITVEVKMEAIAIVDIGCCW